MATGLLSDRLALGCWAVLLAAATFLLPETVCGQPASSPSGGPGAKPRVAIADFTVMGDVGIPDAGKAVTELLIAELGRGPVQLIERSQLSALLKEHDLKLADIVSNPSLVAGKNITGVDQLVVGAVVKFDRLSISARLVDVRTGEVVRTAKVSAVDAAGLEQALGELIGELMGGQVRPPGKVTLEMSATRYGSVVFRGQRQRVGPKQLAIIRDMPANETLKFLPDGDYAPGVSVTATVALSPEGGRKIAAGAVGVVESLGKDKSEDGQPYIVKWGGDAGKSTVSARYLSPVKPTEPEEALSLDSPVEGRTRIVCHYLSREEVEGSGSPPNDSALNADQKKEAARIAAMIDLVRKLGERGVGLYLNWDGNKVTSTSTKFEFYGLAFGGATRMAPSGFTVENDKVWADIPLKDGKVRQVMCEDFCLKNPADVLASGQGQVLRGIIEKHVPKVTGRSDDEGYEYVKAVFSGLILEK